MRSLLTVFAVLFTLQFTIAQEHTGEIIVKYKQGHAPLSKVSGLSKYGLSLVRIPSAKGDTTYFSEYLYKLQSDTANIEYAEPNWIQRIPKPVSNTRQYIEFEIENSPNDPLFNQQYMHSKIETPFAWNKTTGSKEVIIAVIDTGVDYLHKDLRSNIFSNPNELVDGIDNDRNGYVDDINGWDFINGDNNPIDDNAHGTHCAGIIGAVGNNGEGIVGINWQVSILPCKFLDRYGSGSTIDAVEAIYYAADMGVDIMSNSWGGGQYSKALYDAITYAKDKGILFVAAAGNESNDNDDSPSYPASYTIPNVVSVAATDTNDKLASFSNYGKNTVHIAAPGVSILSTVLRNSYQQFSGTSMACPTVSGAAGLLKAAYPNLNYLNIKSKLMDSADQVVSNVVSGRLNIGNAALDFEPEPPEEPPTPPSKCGNNSSAYFGVLILAFILINKLN